MVFRLLTLGVWMLVAASGVYWGLQVWARPAPLPLHAQVPAQSMPSGGDWARVLGAAPVEAVEAAPVAAESSRFALLGVVAPAGAKAAGLALVSVGGEPPTVWRTGAPVAGQTVVLLAVGRRSADFGPVGGPTRFTLALPDTPDAARGTPVWGGGAPATAGSPGMGGPMGAAGPGGPIGPGGPGVSPPSNPRVLSRASTATLRSQVVGNSQPAEAPSEAETE